MRKHLDAQRFTQEAAGHSRRRHTRCGLARRRALEHWTRRIKAVLDHAREIRMARARAGQRRSSPGRHGLRHLRVLQVHGLGGHDGGPLRPFSVTDLDGNRTANRRSVHHAGEQGELIGLKLHAGAAPVAETAAGQLMGNLFFTHRQTCRRILH